MEKKTPAALLITIVIFGAIVGVAFIWMNYFSDYSNVLKINWELSLPHDAAYSEVYSQSSESTFNGDGTRYHVFTYVNTTPISEMLAWQSTEQKTLYSGSYSAAVEEWLDKLGIPANERPSMKIAHTGINRKRTTARSSSFGMSRKKSYM